MYMNALSLSLSLARLSSLLPLLSFFFLAFAAFATHGSGFRVQGSGGGVITGPLWCLVGLVAHAPGEARRQRVPRTDRYRTREALW